MCDSLHPEPVKSRARWLNAALMPIKQHVVCCGVVKPLVMAGVLGVGAAEIVESVPGEMATILLVAPVVTYGVMRGEAWWHERRHTHAPDYAHPPLTLRRYFREAAISMGFCALTSLGMHAFWPHRHDHAGESLPSVETGMKKPSFPLSPAVPNPE